MNTDAGTSPCRRRKLGFGNAGAAAAALTLALGPCPLGYAGGFSGGISSGHFGGGHAFGSWGGGHSTGGFGTPHGGLSSGQHSLGSYHAGPSGKGWGTGRSVAAPEGGRSFGTFEGGRYAGKPGPPSSSSPDGQGMARGIGARAQPFGTSRPGGRLSGFGTADAGAAASFGASVRGSGAERFSGRRDTLSAGRGSAPPGPLGVSVAGPPLDMSGPARSSGEPEGPYSVGSASSEALQAENRPAAGRQPVVSNLRTPTGQGAATVEERKGNTVIYEWTDARGIIHFSDRRPDEGAVSRGEKVSTFAASPTRVVVQPNLGRPQEQRRGRSDIGDAHGKREFGKGHLHHHRRFHGYGGVLPFDFFSPFSYCVYPYEVYSTQAYDDDCNPDSPQYDPTRLIPYDDQLICCDPYSAYYDPTRCALVSNP
jgi:hypothetical protein